MLKLHLKEFNLIKKLQLKLFVFLLANFKNIKILIFFYKNN